MINPSRSVTVPEQSEKHVTLCPATLSDDLDPAVVRVPGPADQAQFQRAAPRPPPESDALDPSTNPRGQSNRFRGRCV